jgi:hypothetical protein
MRCRVVRLFCCALALVIVRPVVAAEPGRWTLALDVGGARVERMPLTWSTRQVQLLTREGRLWSFDPSDAKSYRKSSATFQSYPVADIRERLARELGKSFEVSNTGHFLVAHPKGQRDVWSPRFEKLYHSFKYYFSVRGFNVNEPEFPLVAIVWSNQSDFLRYAASENARVAPGTLGYYSQKSNRITLFDTSGGAGGDAWQQNADTIIHEATHQTAFNTGVHRRFAVAPRWLVEGLAMMFEAPGVHSSRQFGSQQDRINRDRLAQFKRLVEKHQAAPLESLIASDNLFQTDVNTAYAYAWALSFYLVETQPQKYSKYLAMTAKRPVFEDYSTAARVADFMTTLGANQSQLDARFLRFMAELK